MTTILNLMVKDHIYLAELLNRVKEAKGKSYLLNVFSDFKWALEKHLFIEEKAIFCFCDCEEHQEILTELLKEHEMILRAMRDMQDDLEEGMDVDVNALQNQIMRHKEKEEEQFYPKLDETLSADLKKKIEERITTF